MRSTGSRRTLALSIKSLLLLIVIFTALGFTFLTLRPVDPSTEAHALKFKFSESKSSSDSDEQQGEDGYLDSRTPTGGYNDSSALSGQPREPNSRWANNRGFERKEVGGEGETKSASCATVEKMGEVFWDDRSWKESIRVRKLIQRHFEINGASRVRALPPHLFCKHGFVIAKASEAGFGNEMYKILTAAALSVMLNRSLIIGQTRHIGYP